MLNIRAEGYFSLTCLNEINRGTIVGARMLIGRCPYDFQFGKKTPTFCILKGHTKGPIKDDCNVTMHELHCQHA